MPRRNRSGLTLVELLVVIAIVCLLIGLLLPAVQGVRESARQLQCGNRLRQLAIAIQAYHQSNGTFPSASLAVEPSRRNKSCSNHWTMLVWPYVELQGLADTYDWPVGFRGTGYTTVNGGIFRTQIPLYQCPSDAPGVFGNEPKLPQHSDFTRSNYCATASPDGFVMEKSREWNEKFDDKCNAANNPATKKALFNWTVARTAAHVRDGTSNTVALSEVIAGPSGTPDLRGAWWTDLGCVYTHKTTPNSNVPDSLLKSPYCQSSAMAPCSGNSPCWSGLMIAARSLHRGGVNAALADGAVRFVTDAVDAALWINLASIDGAEATSADW